MSETRICQNCKKEFVIEPESTHQSKARCGTSLIQLKIACPTVKQGCARIANVNLK